MATTLTQKSTNVHHVVEAQGQSPLGLIVKGTSPYPRNWGFSPSFFGKKGRPRPALGDFASLDETWRALDPASASSGTKVPPSTLVEGALFGQQTIHSIKINPTPDFLKKLAADAPPLLDLAIPPVVLTGGRLIMDGNWELCSPEVFADTSARDDWRLAIVARPQASPSGGSSAGIETYLWFAHASGPRGWGKDGLFGRRPLFHSAWTPQQVASIEGVTLLIENYQG